jgi:segregation and condensation protein B
MNNEQLKPIIECAILTAGEPLSLQRLRDLFSDLSAEERPTTGDLRAVLEQIANDCEPRGITLKEIASGFCFQAKIDLMPWIKKIWQERPTRYSRALLETLAIIAYRQPVTRAEIEDIRGVAVSSNIVKTLLEHEWVQIVGQREVLGRPSLYATTRQFLDHFNLKSLEELPALMELQDLEAAADQLEQQITLPTVAAEHGETQQ